METTESEKSFQVACFISQGEGGRGGRGRSMDKEEKGDGGRGLRRMALFLVIPRPHSAFQYRGGGGGGAPWDFPPPAKVSHPSEI